jgi:hypothetical protein
MSGCDRFAARYGADTSRTGNQRCESAFADSVYTLTNNKINTRELSRLSKTAHIVEYETGGYFSVVRSLSTLATAVGVEPR